MFCPADVNTGLIQLVGPIASTDLATITVHQPPLMISFGPRTTPPSLVGNRIDESAQNTCTFEHRKYSLADVQIVSPVHTGYNLPGNTNTPQAELILSFSANSSPSSLSELSGLLLCLPIYEKTTSNHGAYLEQVVHQDATTTAIPSLESLFYSSPTDTSQTSFGYRTCFETVDSSHAVHSNSLFVVVFPNGVHMSNYQQLFTLLQQSLSTYQLPPGLRGGDATVRSYTRDNNGNKEPNQLDTNGVMYKTPLSTCTDDFKNRFEYFSKPPRLPSSVSASSKLSKVAQGTCPTVSQYKCVPFDQLKDLNGNYVQVSDGRCLDDVIKSGGPMPSGSSGTAEVSSKNASTSMTISDIEGIVGTIAAVVVIGGIVMFAFSRITKT